MNDFSSNWFCSFFLFFFIFNSFKSNSFTNSCTVNVEANVIASGAEEANEFAVNGSVKVNVVNTCTVEAQISGTAKYVKATEDAESELVLSLQGNATVSATENNE